MEAQGKSNPSSPSGSSVGPSTGSTAGTKPRMPNIPPAACPQGDGSNVENPATGAAKSIPKYVAELKAYAIYFLSAKVEGFKATARNIVVYAALGVIGLLVATGI